MKLLKKLSETPGVPGREHRIRDLIAKTIKPHVDTLKTDAMGNLIAVRKPRPARGAKKPRKPLRVMLAAHMDQIGFLVRHIGEKGDVRVINVGGFDTRNLFSRRALVCTDKGDLPGVLNPAGKPVHIASDEERKKIPEISDLYLELGLDAKTIKRKVKIGDMVVLTEPMVEVGDYVVAQALDNRAGCWAVIKALENLKTHQCEVHAVWTVQEEVGLRGAGPAAFGVEPDIGLSCDTTLACDTPGVPEDQQVTKLGEGICLKVYDSSTIPDIKLVEEIEKVARAKKITHQRGVLARGGQDGAMLQRSRTGCRTAVFACPVRNIHTVCEMSAKSDLESYHKLLTAYLASL